MFQDMYIHHANFRAGELDVCLVLFGKDFLRWLAQEMYSSIGGRLGFPFSSFGTCPLISYTKENIH
jgi:hypothetical protein